MPTEISRDELKQAIDNDEVDYVFDARGHGEYNKSHIKGATSLPADDAVRGIGLPEKKRDMIVFYCTDPDCPASAKAARAAEKRGYSNVYRYKGGIKGWKQAGLPTAAQELHN